MKIYYTLSVNFMHVYVYFLTQTRMNVTPVWQTSLFSIFHWKRGPSPVGALGSSASLALSCLFVDVSNVRIPVMYVPLSPSSYVFLNSFSLSHLWHQRFLSTFCFMLKKNPFSQRCPRWHLQILMVNNLISAACRRQQPGMWDALHCTWSHITPPMAQPLVAE